MKRLTSLTLIVSLLLGSSAPSASEQPAKSSTDAWSRLRKKDPGSHLVIRGSADHYLLSVDESRLVVLTLAEPRVPRGVKEVLRNTAAQHPKLLMDATYEGARLGLDKDISIVGGLLFVGGRDYGPVVAQITRTDIESGAVLIADKKMSRKRKAAIWGAVIGGMFLFFYWNAMEALARA